MNKQKTVNIQQFKHLLVELFTFLFMHVFLIREPPGVAGNHSSQLFVVVMGTQNYGAELLKVDCVCLCQSEYRKRGFQEVVSPNIFNSKLWQTSGHWQHYSENMFSFEVEKETFALKPMNCPGHW